MSMSDTPSRCAKCNGDISEYEPGETTCVWCDLPPYHTNSDGTVPCTNCGRKIVQEKDDPWFHDDDGEERCWSDRDEWACPEAANDADPDFYDERGWART